MKGPVQVAEGAVVFQVLEQKKADAKSAEERASYGETMRLQEARNLRTTLLQRLRKEATVLLNDSLIKPPAQQQAGL